jgi:RNA polymerase sigma-70 factor, ECF subfamily
MSLTVDALVPVQVTAATAVDAGVNTGDRRAGYRLVAAARPAVVRYCRARLGCGDHAGDVARAVCRSLASARLDTADASALTAFVYRTVAAAVDAAMETADTDRAGVPGQLAQLPAAQREVLVLRVVVGLSVEQVAAALSATPDAVRRVQHEALQRLRGAA